MSQLKIYENVFFFLKSKAYIILIFHQHRVQIESLVETYSACQGRSLRRTVIKSEGILIVKMNLSVDHHILFHRYNSLWQLSVSICVR